MVIYVVVKSICHLSPPTFLGISNNRFFFVAPLPVHIPKKAKYLFYLDI